MPVKKRGNKYYSVYISPERKETWISLDSTSKRDAQKKHNLIMSMLKRERMTRQITTALLDLVKALAAQELTKEEIETPIAQIERMAQLEALQVVDNMIPVPPLTAEELWKQYAKSKHSLKPSTLKTKRIRINRFITWAKDKDMRDFSNRDCRAFLKSLDTDAAQTVNNYISDLSSVWKASPDINNPWTADLRQKPNSKRKQAFTNEQVRAIMQYCKAPRYKFWYAATLIAYYTGLRLTDIVHLEYSQISDDGYFDLPPRKTDRSGRRVRIPIHPEIKKVIPVKKGRAVYLFVEQVKLYDIDRGNFNKRFMRIIENLKIKKRGTLDYGFHSLRHTFITNALQAGIDIKQIQAVVGHVDIDVTDGYYHGEKHADLSQYPTLSTP